MLQFSGCFVCYFRKYLKSEKRESEQDKRQ